MATNDLLDEIEAERALNMAGATGETLAEIVAMNSAVSQDIDRICGPVVQRTVTDELHTAAGSQVFLRQRPVVSITTVTEYLSGTGTVLTAESVSTAGGYLFDPDIGMLHRRSAWTDMDWTGRVAVTYVAGRYATTASVGELWKGKARAALRRRWREESPMWARSPNFNAGDDEEYPGLAYNDAFLLSILGTLAMPEARGVTIA